MDIETINKLHNEFPNCSLGAAADGAAYMLDKNGEIMGHIDLLSGELFIAKSYEHRKAVNNKFKNIGLYGKIKEYEELDNE